MVALKCPEVQVTIVDFNKKRIDAWKAGTPPTITIPIYEPGLVDVVQESPLIPRVATSSKSVVEISAVPCRTAESMRTILKANSKSGYRFDILFNPEFLEEGTAIQDLLNPDRVLISSLQNVEGKAACDTLAAV